MSETEFDFEEELTKPDYRRPWPIPPVLIILLSILVLVTGLFFYLRWLRQPIVAPKSQVTRVIRGTGSTLLKSPLDVALYNGKFYVTDAENRRVVVFSENGEPLFDFRGGKAHDVKGSSLVYPAGIAVNSRGDVYVADSTGGKIVVFNETGRALRLLKLPKQKKMVLKPLALDIDGRDNIFISEAVTGYIYQYDFEEKLIRKIGNGRLAFANGIAVDDNGDIYVADSNHQQIVVFNQYGKRLRIIKGQKGDDSFLPRGLDFDKLGNLIVADTLGSRIIELNKMGHLISTWGGPGNGREQFNFPNGIAYGRGFLYVVDRGNNRVTIWHHLP